MWVMVMFDLPVVTKPERKAAARFRADLLDHGFEMAQYSVYVRFCASQSQVSTVAAKVQWSLPTAGRVSLLTFTDKQYERIVSFSGRRESPRKGAPGQLEMF
ncbi:MAG: CRISPR-associated endonuclease Cas2 [Actinobacteria bacterium]|nr:CRISPR-associated endonuclease Cas2 [Actinomycetota bacterium]